MEERIKKIRKDAGLKQAEFAEKIGLKASTVTSYETGLRVPSDAVVVSICREFGVSEVWLRDGIGEPYLKREDDDDLKVIFDEIGVSDDEVIKAIVKSYWHLSDSDKAAVRKLVDRFVDEMSKKKSPGAGPGQG